MFSFFFLLSHLCPCCSPLPPSPQTPQSTSTPLSVPMSPLCGFLDLPLPLPHCPPPPSPLVTVSLFFICMSLVLFCSFACFGDYIPLIGEIIWYLSFTAWLISLSIMLSRSLY